MLALQPFHFRPKLRQLRRAAGADRDPLKIAVAMAEEDGGDRWVGAAVLGLRVTCYHLSRVTCHLLLVYVTYHQLLVYVTCHVLLLYVVCHLLIETERLCSAGSGDGG